MGTTPKYALPWPAGTAKVRDGYAAIRQLAEQVEAALLPPLLVTDGSEAPNYGADGNEKAGEPGWNVTDGADRKRGSWDSNGNAERLVIPQLPGWYLVSTTVRFGGKAEPDWYEVQVRTRQVGADTGTGTRWAGERTELPANSSSYTELSVATIVRIPDSSPRTGIAVRVAYGGANQPPTASPADNKLRVYRLGAL